MKYMLFFLILVVNLYLCYAANGNPDSLQVYESQDSIIVVANRYQTTLQKVAANYQIVTARDIRTLSTHSTMQLVDIEFPSAFVLEKRIIGYGVGSDGAGILNLRGMGSKPNTGVLVLLNGHPDFMGIFGHPLPDVYGTDNIEQMEILPGASSTVFGSNAMGGVVNIVTRPDFRHQIKISAEGGSFGTYNIGLNLARNFGKIGGSFVIRSRHTDGHIANSSFSSLHIQTDWQMRLNPVWSLSLSARYVPYEFDDPARGEVDVVGLGTYGKIERGTGELILKNTGAQWKGSTQIYANMGKHRFYDGFKSNDYAYGFSTYQYWEYSSKIQFAAGGDLMRYGGQAENPFQQLPDGQPVIKTDAQKYNSLGIYLNGFVSPTDLIQLRGGLRAQYHTLNDLSWAPTAGISLFPDKNWQIFANYQFGFRMPTMRELFLFPASTPDLKPEQADMYETGVKYHYGIANFLQATYYHNNIKNLIQTVANPSPPPMELFRNSGGDNQNGLELQAQNHWISVSRCFVSYSYLYSD